ncbi:hypothetical protein [Nonomuraea sp. C10]|uniref:hypothetical protein n=1 Tax=Nonomuraea sp. C10 TaxID=2600577 RepID=UPI0011CDF756|nr:hypothetical protein [Nonomuraea sp. C10]TXK39981.1 hypothetical protein FR742_10615 [Nonomuraea sp. C10]
MTTIEIDDEPSELPKEPLQSVDPYLDMFLHRLVEMGSNASVSVTLFIGGSVLTGDLISYDTWQDHLVDSLATAAPGLAAGMREGIDAAKEEAEQGRQVGDEQEESDGALGPPRRFVHLKDAVLINGGSTVAVPLWRGRMECVDGWMLGRFQNF